MVNHLRMSLTLKTYRITISRLWFDAFPPRTTKLATGLEETKPPGKFLLASVLARQIPHSPPNSMQSRPTVKLVPLSISLSSILDSLTHLDDIFITRLALHISWNVHDNASHLNGNDLHWDGHSPTSQDSCVDYLCILRVKKNRENQVILPETNIFRTLIPLSVPQLMTGVLFRILVCLFGKCFENWGPFCMAICGNVFTFSLSFEELKTLLCITLCAKKPCTSHHVLLSLIMVVHQWDSAKVHK